MIYIIRDHDNEKFEQRKAYMQQTIDELNKKYNDRITLEINDQYMFFANLHFWLSMLSPFLALCKCSVHSYSKQCRVSSSPQPFWHQGLVSWKTIFPWTWGGEGVGLEMIQELTFIVHFIFIIITSAPTQVIWH